MLGASWCGALMRYGSLEVPHLDPKRSSTLTGLPERDFFHAMGACWGATIGSCESIGINQPPCYGVLGVSSCPHRLKSWPPYPMGCSAPGCDRVPS